VRLLADPGAGVSRAAAAALQELGDAARAELARAFVQGRADRVLDLARQRQASAAALLLTALLLDRRPATRHSAARLLGELGDPEAIPALQDQSRWWNEPEAPVRQACRMAVAAIRAANGAVGSEPTPAAPPAGSGREVTG
jgi:HEAT repeat protein